MRRLILTTLAVLVTVIPLRAKTANRHDMRAAIMGVSAKDIVRDIKTGTFRKIYAEGDAEVLLKHGSKCSVKVEGTDADLKRYNVKVTDGTLCCKYKGRASGGGRRSTPKIKLYVTMPDVSRIEMHGISSLKSSEMHSEGQLSLRCGGSATITTDLVYARESVWLTTEAVGKIQTGNIRCWNLKLAATGSSNISMGQIKCDHDVKMTCSGGAAIQSKDIDGETLKASVSGCGKVNADNLYATGGATVGLSGSSTFCCSQLVCKEANVLTEGAGWYEGDILTRGKGEARLTCHGCSKVKSGVKAGNVVLNLTGSSQAKMTFRGNDATLVCEGAASAKAKLDSDTLRAIARNIAKIHLSGSARKTDINADPNATIDVSGLKRF